MAGRDEARTGTGRQHPARSESIEGQTPGGWRVDGPIFTTLQQSVTDSHAVLAWLRSPPRSEEGVKTFAKLFPVVIQLEALSAVMVKEKVPEAGEYLDANDAAMQALHAKVAAGVMTSEAARRMLAELEERRGGCWHC
jgi:hypothetical protein